MGDYTYAVSQWSGEGIEGKQEQKRHLNKLKIFITSAGDCLHKHFSRWLRNDLLPAGLLSEAPLARVLACAMLGKSMPTFDDSDTTVVDERRTTGRIVFNSAVHDCKIDLVAFNSFIRARRQLINDNQDIKQDDKAAAQILVDCGDLRSFDYEDTDHGANRWYMHSTYLPLACQTQFVERGVKEAKYVSATDRSEEHRTWLAIIRSASPLEKAKKDINVSRIKSLLHSASTRSFPHALWKQNQVNDEYDRRFEHVQTILSKQGHFRADRINSKLATVDEKGAKYKRPNAAQQTKQQHKTPAVTGKIPFGKVVQGKHMEDLLTELTHRGVPLQEIPKKITERKALLKTLEATRLMEDESMKEEAASATASKHFKIMSTASFSMAAD